MFKTVEKLWKNCGKTVEKPISTALSILQFTAHLRHMEASSEPLKTIKVRLGNTILG